MDKETAINIGNTVPYALIYAFMTQNKSSSTRFHLQALGFLACTSTWYLSNQVLSRPLEAPIMLRSIPEHIINSEFYNLTQKSISGLLTGTVYAIGRKNNIFIFGSFGLLFGSFSYFINGIINFDRITMPITSLYNHILWLNPFEVVDNNDLVEQYKEELRIVSDMKSSLLYRIKDLTEKINSN
eukprot:NODE_212_length_14557_cov_0.357103.p6 type:complete len:184 gc:universal NODE_212_length_14557_cov_0.357103:4396-3845(-)